MRWVIALVLLAGCARNNTTRDGGVMEFDVDGIRLRLSSGAARDEGGGIVGIYFTDQPDACLAIKQVPAGLSTVLTLRVAPRGDGAMAADVVARTGGDPAPGEAIGNLRVTSAGTETALRNAADGSVAWKKNDDDTTTVTALDVGFAGTEDRVTTSGELTIPACD